jgi:hypothetical protein
MSNPSSPELAKRASAELHAAADALLRANALLAVIKRAVEDSDLDGLCAHSLIETSIELTRVYAERAEGEADFFAEAVNG